MTEERNNLNILKDTPDSYAVINENLKKPDAELRKVHDIRRAHIKEASEIIIREIHAESGADNALSAILSKDSAEKLFRDRAISFGGGEDISGNDLQLLCADISDMCGKKDIDSVLPSLISPPVRSIGKIIKISLIKSLPSIKAFENFAKVLRGAEAVYGEDFQSMCDGTEDGSYTVIPIYNTSDGRLNSFYKLIEKYELNIILTTDVLSPDGENNTRFALLGKSPEYIKSSGKSVMEIKITLESASSIGDIVCSAEYFGIETLCIDALPYSFSGRENSYELSFDVSSGDCGGFICYMKLKYPQYYLTGIYTLI